MNTRLDYLSAILNREFDYTILLEVAEQPVVEPTTGLIVGRNIEPFQLAIDKRGKYTIARTYGGGQEVFKWSVKAYKLQVCRVDLNVDLAPLEGYEAVDLAQRIVDRVKNFYSRKRRRIAQTFISGHDRYGNLTYTWYFGKRKSEYQIRIYTKHSSADDFGVCRIEFQLRGKLSKSVWEIISERNFTQEALDAAFFATEVKLLERNIFLQEYKGSLLPIEREEPSKPSSSREQWFRGQVLQAAIKEFNESGRNLPEILLELFNAHFVQIAQDNIEFSQITTKLSNRQILS